MNEKIGQTMEEFIEKNQRLVYSICNKYTSRAKLLGWEYQDLVNTGMMGLIKSYHRYDPDKFDKGTVTSITTYAVPMIKGEILRWMRDENPSGLKFTRQAKEAFSSIIKNGLEEEKPEVISERLDIPLFRVYQAIQLMNNKKILSLDQDALDNDGDSVTFSDQQGTEDDQTSMFVQDFLEWLPVKQRKVIELKMKDLTQDEIAEKIGFSQVQVSRYLAKIGDLYEQYLNGDGLVKKHGQGDLNEAKRLLIETELPVEEITKVTGCNENTIKTYAHRLRKKDNQKKIPVIEQKEEVIEQDVPLVTLKPQYQSAVQIMKKILDGQKVVITDEEVKNKIENAISSLGVQYETKVNTEWTISLAV